MIGGYFTDSTATTAIPHWSVTGTSTISTTTLTAANEWWPEAPRPSAPDRRFDRDVSHPWVASSVVGRIPVVVELRAGRVYAVPSRQRDRHHRPTWATALRAFHRDPRGLSREAK